MKSVTLSSEDVLLKFIEKMQAQDTYLPEFTGDFKDSIAAVCSAIQQGKINAIFKIING